MILSAMGHRIQCDNITVVGVQEGYWHGWRTDMANPRETLGPHVSPTAAGHHSDDPDRDSVKAE